MEGFECPKYPRSYVVGDCLHLVGAPSQTGQTRRVKEGIPMIFGIKDSCSQPGRVLGPGGRAFTHGGLAGFNLKERHGSGAMCIGQQSKAGALVV